MKFLTDLLRFLLALPVMLTLALTYCLFVLIQFLAAVFTDLLVNLLPELKSTATDHD